MADQLQLRGGTTSEHSTFTGALREVTVDTDKDTVVVHDGSTAGGHPLAKQNLSNVPAGTITSTMIADGTIVNADVNASAAIAGTKISPDFGSQNRTSTGTSTAASFIPSSSTVPTNGVYLPAANQVAVATNGTGRLFVNSNGSVGIGTSSSTAGLYVRRASSGNQVILDNTGEDYTGLEYYNNGNRKASVQYRNTENLLRIDAFAASSQIAFRTVDTERLRITSAGLVGIGTSSPAQALHVNGSGTQYLQISSTSNDATTLLGATSSGSFLINRSTTLPTQIWTNGSPRIHISSAGNVGIGTASPSEKLSVVGNASFSGASPFIDLNGSAVNQTATIRNNNGSSTTLKLLSGNIVFGSDTDVERARIDSSGRLLVGTSTARSNLYNNSSGVAPQVQLEGTSFVTSSMMLVRNSADSSDANIILGKTRGTSTGASTIVSSGDEVGAISFQGADGSELVEAASIAAVIDGTPGANDMPGRLVFSTTADGASSPTERLRIDSSGRVGIGTTSPGSYSANNLVISDSGHAGISIVSGTSNTGNLYFADGTVGNNAFRGYIQYNHTNNDLLFGTDAQLRVRIDSSGRLGIGTSSVSARLHVRSSADDSTPIIRAQSNNQTQHVDLGFYYINYDNGTTSSPLEFQIDGSTKMALSATGLGIGTTTPGTPLHVTGSGIIAQFLNTQNSTGEGIGLGNGTNIGRITSNGAACNLVFEINGSEKARLDTSGRLLVGTSTARTNFYNTTYSSLLQVEADVSATALASLTSSNNGTLGGLLVLGHQRSGSVGGNTILQSGDELGVVAFMGSDGAEQVEGAHIKAAVDGTPGSNDLPTRLVFSTTADGASSPTQRFRIGANGACIFENGSILIGSTAIASGAGNATLKYNTPTGVVSYDTSSRLVKEQIVDCPYGISELKQLKPRKYFRTDDQKEEIGFIADEMAQVMPEFAPIGAKSVVTRNAEDTEQIPIGVNYEKLTAVLTKALQEAIAKIETLEAKVAALESKP